MKQMFASKPASFQVVKNYQSFKPRTSSVKIKTKQEVTVNGNVLICYPNDIVCVEQSFNKLSNMAFIYIA